MKDITLDAKLKALGGPQLQQTPKTDLKAGEGEGVNFNDVLKKAIAEVSGLEKEADRQIIELATGRADNLQDAMLALQKADISFRTLMAIRDKLIEAYREVMRLSV
ncbi:MAG: flagellar hook-basal body complex protein FliE [Myxococcales bacterium]|nr:flagellar hook-basal body complex protein FliE [Myxococcales bacterium]